MPLNNTLRPQRVKLKHLTDEFVTNTVFGFSRCYLIDWSGVDYSTCGLLWLLYFYQLFGPSFWWHPFTAEHPLVCKWCNATFFQIWRRNKLILDGLGVSAFSAHLIFGWTFALTPLSAVILRVKPKSLSCILLSLVELWPTWYGLCPVTC